ncbi:MAG: hypothetical protein C0399_09675 [Syntrophus sp. (in: bacteria)]|nr:hypothetical protein [Syntrophus sp. (in: bacteria)]
MEEIIKAINNALDVEKKVEAFFALSKDEKKMLLEELQHIKTEVSGFFLNAIYPEEKDKDIQKLIRKLLFKLKSAGIKTEEPKTSGGPVIRKIEGVRERFGYLTNYDEMQTRLVVVGLEIKNKAFVFLNAETHFSRGLLDLMTAPVEKKGFDEIIKAYRNDTKPPKVFEEISPAYAGYLIEEASNRSGTFREEMRPLKSFTANIADAVHKPKDIYSLAISDTTDGAAINTILSHGVFVPFQLSWNSFEEDQKTYNSTSGGTIILPTEPLEDKKKEFLKDLTNRKDMKSLRPFFRRMLEDYAYLFYRTKEFDSYKGITEYLNNNDTLQEALSYFIKKSLERGETKKEDGWVIVNPYG